jgi:hypothetical protein
MVETQCLVMVVMDRQIIVQQQEQVVHLELVAAEQFSQLLLAEQVPLVL